MRQVQIQLQGCWPIYFDSSVLCHMVGLLARLTAIFPSFILFPIFLLKIDNTHKVKLQLHMHKLTDPNKNAQKSFSRSKSKERMDLASLKDLHKPKQPAKPQAKLNVKASNRTKSHSKQKSNPKSSKDSKRDGSCSHLPLERANTKPNLLIHNRKRLTASEDKLAKKEKFFKRKNQNGNRNSNSKKQSKRSTDNQNEETQIERLKAENEYYKKAFLASKESLQKMQKHLQEQRKRRNNNKEWFKHQINSLKKKISGDNRIQLGHIFTFDSFRHDEISNMIIETENESSSVVAPPKMEEDILDALSDLSIESK